MTNLIRKAIDFIFYFFLPPVFSFYEKHLFYRFRIAYGKGIARLIINKGQDLRVHGRCTLISPSELEIGDYVRIGNNCYFFCIGGIKIGNNVQFSRDITLYASNHDYESRDSIPYDSEHIKKSIVIEDNVWIGMGASVLPGVKIGEGAIIGMNTVVSKDVEKYSIVVGASQRVIGHRNIELYNELNKNEKWFGKLFPDA